MKFLTELNRRNKLLYWYGAFNFIAVLICIFLIQITSVKVLGINAWIKPMKFYLSIGIFVWTMAWLMYYLQMPAKSKFYTWMAIIVFSFESFVISWQAANGRLSHFNVSTPLYSWLFSFMGIAITVLTIWTSYIGYLFFKKKSFDLPSAYLWGIRLGIIFFVVFAFEGGIMAALLRHTMGAPDGGIGLPVVNWSREHGDLRIAHFFGMHALQLFPLFGFFIAKNKNTVFLFSAVYFSWVTFLLIEALFSHPLL